MIHNFTLLSLYYLLVTGVPCLIRASPIDEAIHTNQPPSYSVQQNDAVEDVCPFYISRKSSQLADAFDRFHGLFYEDLSTSFAKYSGPAGGSMEGAGFTDSDTQNTRQELLVASEYLAKLQPDFKFDADGAVTAVASTDNANYHVFTLDTCFSTSFYTASDICASLSSSHLSDPSGMLFRGVDWSGIDTSQLDDRRTIVINIPVRSNAHLSIFTNTPSGRIADCHTILNFFAVDSNGDYDTTEASFTVIRDGYDSFEGFILAPNGYIEDVSPTEYISGKVFAMQLKGIRELGEFSCGGYQGCFPVREHLEIMSPRAVEDEVLATDLDITTLTVTTVGPSTLSPSDLTSVSTSTITTGPSTLSPTEPTSISTSTITTAPSTLSPTEPTSISTSTISSSSSESSTTDESSTSGSSTDKSSTDESSTDESSTDESSTDESSTDESSTDESSTDESSTDESSTDESSTDESSTDESSSSSEEPTSDTSSSTESTTISSSSESSSSITTDESTSNTCSTEITTATESRTTTTTTGTLTETDTTTKTITSKRTVGTASITITESETITMTTTATNTFTSIDSTQVTSTTIHTTSKPTVWVPVQNQWLPDVNDGWDDEY